jgi:hypothetical protein
MSSREFAEWIAYAGMEPFGETRADLRIATVAAFFAEANRDRKQRRKPYTVGEFVELFRGGAEAASPAAAPGGGDDVERKKAELWANVRAWAMRNSSDHERREGLDHERRESEHER